MLVIGAGPVGTAIAWRAAQRGRKVTLVDPDPQRGAWRTAAGILAPITEVDPSESALVRLNLESMARYRAFTAELHEVTGLPTGYLECGALEPAWDPAEVHALEELHRLGSALGVSSQLLTADETVQLEPALGPGVVSGLYAVDDSQVDPRLLHAALLRAATDLGVEIVAASGRPDIRGGRAVGARLEDGTALTAQTVVLAAGAWSGQLFDIAVRPVKGQTIRLRSPAGLRLARVLHATVAGSPIYLVPRTDGRIVVGASSEDAGFDLSPRAGAIADLLDSAQRVVPALSEAVFEEVSTGLRPAPASNSPLIGPTEVDGLVVATGHYRDGILLTPVTADAIAEFLVEGALPDVVAPFIPTQLNVTTPSTSAGALRG